MMGGHIWVESEGPGKGTTVTFVVRLGLPDKGEEKKAAAVKAAAQKAAQLPGAAGQNAAAAAAAAAAPAVDHDMDFTGVKVLVCDDNQ